MKYLLTVIVAGNIKDEETKELFDDVISARNKFDKEVSAKIEEIIYNNDLDYTDANIYRANVDEASTYGDGHVYYACDPDHEWIVSVDAIK